MAKIGEPEVVFCEYNHIYDKSLSAECPYCKQIAERTSNIKKQIDTNSWKGSKKRGFGRQDSEDEATTLLSRGWAALTGRSASAARKPVDDDDDRTELLTDNDDHTVLLKKDEDDDATQLLSRGSESDDDATQLLSGRTDGAAQSGNMDAVRMSIFGSGSADIGAQQTGFIIIRDTYEETPGTPAVEEQAAEEENPDLQNEIAEETMNQIPEAAPEVISIPLFPEVETETALTLPEEEVPEVIPEEEPAVPEQEEPVPAEEIPAEEAPAAAEPVKVRRKVIGWLVCTRSEVDFGSSVELQEGENYICFDEKGHMEVIHDQSGEAWADAVIYRDQITGMFRIRQIHYQIRVNDRTPEGSTYLEPYSGIALSAAGVVFFPTVGVCGFEWRQ